jgi:hypothetical protein
MVPTTLIYAITRTTAGAMNVTRPFAMVMVRLLDAAMHQETILHCPLSDGESCCSYSVEEHGWYGLICSGRHHAWRRTISSLWLRTSGPTLSQQMQTQSKMAFPTRVQLLSAQRGDFCRLKFAPCGFGIGVLPATSVRAVRTVLTAPWYCG